MAGREKEAAALVASMKSDIAALEAAVKDARRTPCYYVVSFGDYGNWTCGPGSFLDELITLSGGDNLGSLIGKPWGVIQLEKIVTLEPEIILAGKFSGPLDRLKDEPGYRDLACVKAGRIMILDDDLVGRPGPRIVQGLREIAEALHPELFMKEKN
jgi:iron complex transport system substrate-binding protein